MNSDARGIFRWVLQFVWCAMDGMFHPAVHRTVQPVGDRLAFTIHQRNSVGIQAVQRHKFSGDFSGEKKR